MQRNTYLSSALKPCGAGLKLQFWKSENSCDPIPRAAPGLAAASGRDGQAQSMLCVSSLAERGLHGCGCGSFHAASETACLQATEKSASWHLQAWTQASEPFYLGRSPQAADRKDLRQPGPVCVEGLPPRPRGSARTCRRSGPHRSWPEVQRKPLGQQCKVSHRDCCCYC